MARNKETSMLIEDRLLRMAPEDVIHIGGVIETLMDSEAGKLLIALLNGRIAMEARAKDTNVSSDKRMGRIEMCQTLLDDLEQYIMDRNKLLLERVKEKPKVTQQDGPSY